LLAYVKEARAGSFKTISYHIPAVSARATALGGQLCTSIWFHFWILIVLCIVAICFIWTIRPSEENLPDLGVPVICVVPVLAVVVTVLPDTNV